MSRIEELIREKCPDGVEYKIIGEICTIVKGVQLNKDFLETGGLYPVINGGVNPSGYWDDYNFEANLITISQGGASAGYVNFIDSRFWAGAHCYVIKECIDSVIYRYVYHFIKLNQINLMQNQVGAGIPSVSLKTINSLEIPVPPIQVQQEIVCILDKFTELEAELQSELAARKKQYEYYRMKLLTFDEDMSTVMFPEISDNFDRKRKPITGNQREQGDIPYYGASGVIDYVKDYLFEGDYLLISEDGANLTARVSPIAFSISGRTWVNNHAHILQFRTDIERKFVEYYLNSIDLSYYITGAAQPKLNQDNLNKIPIPNPSFVEKKKIVEILDVFSELCEDEETGLPAEIAARHKQYEYYRDKLLTFKRKEV